MPKELSFGIDLGTTNSCIACFDGKSAKMLTLTGGARTMPSCVLYDKGRVIVGRKAYEKRYLGKQVVYSCKRDMGTDTLYEIDDGEKKFSVSPVEVSAEILKALKTDAEKRYEQAIQQVVITVPAYFNDRQKRDTLAAGKLAGFTYVRLLAEPSAAAVAYTGSVKKPERVIVYDLGGGTFDVSLLDILPASQGNDDLGIFGDMLEETSAVATVDVLKIEGNNRLGGDDFDLALYRKLCAAMTKVGQEEYGFSSRFVFKDQISSEMKERLILAMETVKKGYNDSTRSFGIPVKCSFGDKEFSEDYTVDTEAFTSALEGIFEETVQCFDRVLSSSDKAVDKIILIGGSTKFPLLRSALQEMYPDIPVFCNISPDYSVAIGAAMVAAADKKIMPLQLFDVVPQNIGIRVNRVSLGVVKEDAFEPIVPKSASIPDKWGTTVRTERPEQTEAILSVYEGDSQFAEENELLGELRVTGIQPKTDKPTAIYVSLRVDINGLLYIQADYDDKSETLELTNVVKSRGTGEAEDPATKLLEKRWSRYERLLRKHKSELNMDDITCWAKEKHSFAQTKEFSKDFMALIERTQEKERAMKAKQRDVALQAGEELYEECVAAETMDSPQTQTTEITQDRDGKIIDISRRWTLSPDTNEF